MIEILAISPLRDDVAVLLEHALAYAKSLYPGGSIHTENATQLARPNVHFVGVFEQQKLVGIGAVKILTHDLTYGEIKSIFVLPEVRGQGAARKIMQTLEDRLQAHGVKLARLETGVAQTAAIALYRSLGYEDCGPFGDYKPDPLSLFMQKQLAELSGSESI